MVIPASTSYVEQVLRGLAPDGHAIVNLFNFSAPASSSGGMPLSAFPNLFHAISFAFTFPPDILRLVFWLAVVVFGLMCLALFYVWERFEFDKVRIRLMTLVYFFGGLTILIFTWGAVILYSKSL